MAKKRGKHAHRIAATTAAAMAKKVIQKNQEEQVDLERVNNAAMASVASVGAPVMVKMCRLCESKDGPFLNIFDGEKVLALKINRLLPLVIDEYDKLPHKICFRCSAKVEELHEFAQKCIKAQENLKKTMGSESKASIARKNWEEKLKVSKMSNDDYCESLIKKAMEKIIGPGGVEDEPTSSGAPAPPPQPATQKKSGRPQTIKVAEEPELTPHSDDEDIQPVSKQPKLTLDKNNKNKEEKATPTRPKRSNAKSAEDKMPDEPEKPTNKEVSRVSAEAKNKKASTETEPSHDRLLGLVINDSIHIKKVKPAPAVEKKAVEETKVKVHEKKVPPVNRDAAKERVNGAPEKPHEAPKQPKETEEPEYDIMQHVCTIKVGGAGYLFQCKLCKRNFLKKEVVLGHACAKAMAAKANAPKSEPPKPPAAKVEIPKAPQGLPRLAPKPVRTDKEIIEAFKSRTAGNLSINNFISSEPVLPKPRPGPASRKKISEEPAVATINTQQSQNTPPPPPPAAPSVEVPSGFLASKNRYKLLPGPNNTFTLVEDTTACPGATVVTLGGKRKIPEFPQKKTPEPTQMQSLQSGVLNKRGGRVQKTEVIDLESNGKQNYNPGTRRQETVASRITQAAPQISNNYSTNITPVGSHYQQSFQYQQQEPNLPPMLNRMESQPYPVGLFQTLPRITPPPPPVNFQTPAQKTPTEQYSYVVVPTGNPGKLVISTKQVPAGQSPAPPTVQTKLKKGKKAKGTAESVAQEPKQPFSVTLEETAPPKDSNESFFTFINVDPLLQPSYVLPTTSIIQESQISTSTPAGEKVSAGAGTKTDSDLYSCELCNMEFTREKKLLTHLQTHYAKQDEEVEEHWGRGSAKKRSRKS